MFHAATLKLAPGDVVRITHNGRTADGKHRLNNGSMYKVKDFDNDGNIVLENGWTIGKDWGFLAHGYVVTSHASQGKTVDRVFVGQSSESFPASSREQFYVSASRARSASPSTPTTRKPCSEAVSRSDERLSATELVKHEHEHDREAWREPYPHRESDRRTPEREEVNHER